jgi:hypothetical protein
MDCIWVLKYFSLGLVGILIIDIFGSIASRKLDFNYVYLSVLSFVLYSYIGFSISESCGIASALITNFVIGLIDGTLGVFISVKLKANTNLTEKERRDIPGIYTVLTVLFFALISTIVGYAFALFL